MVMTERFRHLLPVVLGGDIGAYALARQLHEVTGTPVTIVASDPIVAISESAYITVVHQEAGSGARPSQRGPHGQHRCRSGHDLRPPQ